MAFAEPGLAGPLFRYGGTSVRGGHEHMGPFAVIDFETTGLSPRGGDRIIEVAVARVDAEGRIEDEFATLINPDGRDVGATFIHGITNDQVRRAPTFADVVPELLARLDGAVVVAHNATFEEAFLASELKRAGVAVAPIPALCTLWLARQTFATPNFKLGTLARAAGVPLVDKHAALGDVRAVSALLPVMLGKLGSPVLYSADPLAWDLAPGRAGVPLVTRAVALRKGADGWMQSLISRLPSTGTALDDAASEAYLDALSDVLADGKLIGDEAKLLAKLAGSAGMGAAEVLSLNHRFLDGLREVALADDVLTASELRQLHTAAKALSLPDYFGELRATAPEPVTATVTANGSADGGARSSRESRAERARLALMMQRAGANRAAIASALGVTQETVKGLLRDAKFYENPESDPSRLALARDALCARGSGMTRTQFQHDRGITAGKSSEAWRDAAMLTSI
ncbi:exonuclease domain-containing protein [Nocardioides ochotonae]|uniref:exonuclease domain-containing protein n=1 Tax=Nocardioides ochotonae TaxID=2685869 RepID=UPI001408744A